MNLLRFAFAALAALSLGACSANSGSSFSGGGGNGGSSSGGAGAVAHDGGTTDGSGGSEFDAMIPIDGGPNQDVGLPPDGDTCSAQTVAAEPYPLDMYVMMDQSGSMDSPAGLGVPPKSQWQAVVDAFSAFLTNNTTTGLGMGIQYFPINVVPWNTLTACDDKNPCPNDGACVNYDGGRCFAKCSSDSECAPGAECMPTDNGSFCSNTSCVADDYAKPDVEIGPLPQNNQALLASLKAHKPTTMTPTVPALQGAIAHASEWAKAHPDRKVIVVLATDGMPTVCDADKKEGELINEVKQVAQAGVNANPSIKTFVIGVVMPGDVFSQGKLDSMAQAGGTGHAFIVDPNQDMTAAFTQALQNIRGAAMQCEFKIPPDPYLAYDEVNVVYQAEDGTKVTVYYVGDVSKCDPVNGGWFYDTPDPNTQTPSKIILCPNSCDFMQKYGGKISIEIGCETVVPPK